MVGTYVIYLVWAPLGLEPLERFAGSYRAHPARQPHRLVLVLKGVTDRPLASRCAELADELGADRLDVPATGLDLDTYAEAAQRLDGDRFCFLNSSSEILADSWLASMAGAFEPPSVGLVGATGSHESALSAAPRPLRPFLRHRYPGFPNAHVRTNAFMLDRELMLSLHWPGVERKRRALELESGTGSITRQVTERGLQALVVGRNGRHYGPADWQASHTFRSGSQENLLIADNRTRQYAEVDLKRRTELARMAWGDSRGERVSPEPPAPEPPA